MARFSKTNKYNTECIKPIYFIPEILPGEIFLTITDIAAPGILPYYSISNYGRIWHKYANHFMRTSWDGPGYRIAVLRTVHGATTFRVHRLLMMTHRYYVGCESMMVNHIDGCKTRNYIDFPGIPNPDNLEWVTGSENVKHAEKLGLKKYCLGEEHQNATLTNEQVEKICEMLEQGNLTNRQVAEINNTTLTIVENIKYKRSWKQISENYNFGSTSIER